MWFLWERCTVLSFYHSTEKCYVSSIAILDSNHTEPPCSDAHRLWVKACFHTHSIRKVNWCCGKRRLILSDEMSAPGGEALDGSQAWNHQLWKSDIMTRHRRGWRDLLFLICSSWFQIMSIFFLHCTQTFFFWLVYCYPSTPAAAAGSLFPAQHKHMSETLQPSANLAIC